jgi:hypothetical protein
MRGGSPFPGRRGNHHGGGAAATVTAGASAVAVLAAAALLAFGAPSPRAAAQEAVAPAEAGLPAARPSNPYIQRGVPAEATAENGVIARERALAAGRRAAWERLASELGVTRSLSDAQIESMVDSIVIEQERTSPTRYAGRITVNFNAGRVRGQTGAGAVAGNAAGGGLAGTGAVDPAAMPRLGPPVVTVDAIASYNSLGEWLELRRRLVAAPEVARLDIVAIAVDAARLRIGLRMAAPAAAEGLVQNAGVVLAPGLGPGGASGSWQVGLAGGR